MAPLVRLYVPQRRPNLTRARGPIVDQHTQVPCTTVGTPATHVELHGIPRPPRELPEGYPVVSTIAPGACRNGAVRSTTYAVHDTAGEANVQQLP